MAGGGMERALLQGLLNQDNEGSCGLVPNKTEKRPHKFKTESSIREGRIPDSDDGAVSGDDIDL